MRAAINLAAGDVVDGRYEIVKALGAGGSGAVYAAIDTAAASSAARNVAIKVLSANDDFGDDHRSGLELEFSLLARLNHPNVVSALAIGVTADGTAYLVEELVVGPTLEDARHSLVPPDYYWIAHGVLEGLAHVHRRGWVHHDIKPANILLANTKGNPPSKWLPKIADLGVASLRDSDPEGRVSGTVPFLSPERLVGQLADPRSDVWAVGMSLLFCISGTLPVDVDSVRAAARILGDGPLPALRDLCPDAPQELEVVIGRMLSSDRRARFRDGTDALTGLRRAMTRAGLEVPDLPASTLAQTPSMVGRDEVLSEALRRLGPGRARATRVVVVRGERGSGRSRFLKEVALEVQLRGARAVFVDAGVGVAPWRRALWRLGVSGVGFSVEAVASALIDAFEKTPVVLLVDDSDARDSVAHRLLERLRGALGASRHMAGVVMTGDLASDWSDADPIEQTLSLEKLTDAEMEALISSALGTDVGPQTVVRLTGASAGNPARVVAAMTNAVKSGALERVAGVWELDGDARVFEADAGAQREAFRELSETSQTMLVALAVLGPSGAPVELDLAREVAGLERDRFAQTITALCHIGLAGLTGTGDPTATEVALVGRVGELAFEAGGPELVRAFHERAWRSHIARGTRDSAVLARHAWGAELDAEAAELTSAAVVTALTSGDYAAALALTDHLDDSRLLTLSDDVVRRIRVARAYALVELSRPLDGAKLAAGVLAEDPDNVRAAQVVVRAAVAAGDSVRAKRALDVVSNIHQRHGASLLDEIELAALGVEVARVNRRPDEVESAAAAALVHIKKASNPLLSDPDRVGLERARGRVHTALGASLALGGKASEGQPVLEKALEIFSAIGDHARIAEVSAFLAAAADLRGLRDERTVHLNRGLESAERAGADSSAARLLNIRGLSLLWLGRTEESIEAFEEAERRARRPGLYRVVSAVSGNLVVVHRRAGQYSSALEAARRSLRVKMPLGDKPGIIATTLNLADVFNDLGAYNLSAAAGRRVVRKSIAIDNRRIESNGRVTLASALIAEGKFVEARTALGWVTDELDKLEHQAELEVRLAVAGVLAGERELSQAADRYRQIEREARSRDEPFIAADAAYRRGVLLGEVGSEDLRRAIEAATRCSAGHILWRARAQLGLILTTVGDDKGAGAEFARAGESLDEVLAHVPTRHVTTYLQADDRVALVSAIRAGAGFGRPDRPRTKHGAESTSATTVIPVPSDSRETAAAHDHHDTIHEHQIVTASSETLSADDRDPKTALEEIGDLETIELTDTPDQE